MTCEWRSRNVSIFVSSAALILETAETREPRHGPCGIMLLPLADRIDLGQARLVAGPAGTHLRHGDAVGAGPLCSAQFSAPNIFTKSD